MQVSNLKIHDHKTFSQIQIFKQVGYQKGEDKKLK